MQPDRPVQTTLAFHASRIVIDVGVLLAMLSMSLTFVSSPAGTRSALAADAFPAVILLLPIFLVTLVPDHTRPLHPALGWASMVLALAALPYAFVKMIDAGILADTLGGSVGIGPVVLLIGCLVTLAGIGIGIVRDLLGKPSGGTPQRAAAYATTRRPGAGGTDGSGRAPRAAAEATRVMETPVAAAPAETRRESEPQPDDRPEPGATPSDDEGVTRIIPAVRDAEAAPARPRQPEILFPDTGAVAREAEPEPQPEDGTMTTAERADAALTDHLLTMFDDGDLDESGEH